MYMSLEFKLQKVLMILNNGFSLLTLEWVLSRISHLIIITVELHCSSNKNLSFLHLMASLNCMYNPLLNLPFMILVYAHVVVHY